MNHRYVFIDNVFDQFLKNNCTFEKNLVMKLINVTKSLWNVSSYIFSTNGHAKAIGAWCSLKKDLIMGFHGYWIHVYR